MHPFNSIHPETTPEHYILNPLDKRIKYRKGLYIPSDPTQVFKIVFDEPKNTLNKYINSIDKLDIIPLHPKYHMYMDFQYFEKHTYLNIIATKLYKMSFLNFVGKNSKESIYGPVLIYGTSHDLTSCSVPYELIEQTFRLYDNY